MTFLFPGDLRGIPCSAVPRSLAIPGSSSREPRLLFRAVSASNLPAGRSRRAPSLGFLSSIATSAQRVHLTPGFPCPDYGPPSVFLTPSTVYSSSYLAGLFHPATASEVYSTGVFPVTQPSWLVASPCSLDLLTSVSFAVELPLLHQLPKRGLQSVDPGADPLAPTEFLRPPAPRSPLELSNPSGLQPRTLGAPSRLLRS